jgi:hypothetical protein
MGIFSREDAGVFQERTLFFKWNAEARQVFARLEDYALVSDREGLLGLSVEPTGAAADERP